MCDYAMWVCDEHEEKYIDVRLTLYELYKRYWVKQRLNFGGVDSLYKEIKNGSMYVCFDEFLDNEYMDIEFMKVLMICEDNCINVYELYEEDVQHKINK